VCADVGEARCATDTYCDCVTCTLLESSCCVERTAWETYAFKLGSCVLSFKRPTSWLLLVAGLQVLFGGCSLPQFEFKANGDQQVDPGDPNGGGGAVADGGQDSGPAPDGAGTCRDSLKNQDETDIDCGGLECPPCESGMDCRIQGDCREGVCTDGECRLPTCTDGVLNGTETDVDCGDICAPCQSGASCADAGDCQMRVCTDGVCQDESCGDRVQNGDETDVDCGGSCKKCDVGLVCESATDCLSGACNDGADKPGSLVNSSDPTIPVCQPPACDDEVQNGDEVDVDCAGACSPCGVGKTCAQPEDCLSLICVGDQCTAPDCADEVKNGTESDIDCGGSGCAACISGKACTVGSDCDSGSCGNGVCLDPACPDNVANGTETDVDCGGPNCPKCAPNLVCAGPGDCDSNHCVGNICQAASCEDLVRNQDETDVDCGGSCPARCETDEACLGAIDCISKVCTGGFCVAATCNDGVANGTEADVDCGRAASGCPRCQVGATCTLGTDCANGVCTDGFCQAAGCGDDVKNGFETDIDCGGGQCTSCDPDATCALPDDCTSLVCTSTVCQTPTCNDTVQNSVESDVDCGGGFCSQCDDGKKCFAANDCNSLVCTSAVCQAPTCLDNVKNQGESDIDCGGLNCNTCAPGKSCALPDDCSSLVCSGGRCQTPTCSDVVENGNETDIDCGGPSCFKCDIGKGCSLGLDCTSGVCTGGLCQAPSCFDGTKNGFEIDIDCGGTCGKCGTGQFCTGPTDCLNGVCTASKCAAPLCTDMVRNAAETDVDCGGGTCSDCANGKTCWVVGDCVSGVCISNICQVPSCTDVVKNGLETDIDCGGANQCARCADDLSCALASDCVSSVCSGNPKKCQPAACPDGVQNGNETDVDCGGGGVCPKCEDTEGCSGPADCVSGVCTNEQCAAPLCTDVVKNGNETDVDCGGTCPGKCTAGKACSVPADCQAGVCTNNFCQSASCNDALQNGDETDLNCGGSCAKCGTGKKCSIADDCSSSVCSGSPQTTCQAATCTDVVKNGGESAIDCGGSTSCDRCAGGLSCTDPSDCVSGICASNICTTSNCNDSVKNGTETDTDCGGSCSTKCADLKACSAGTDCVSGVCSGNICQVPACNDTTKNGIETDIDCGGSVSCADCGTDKRCLVAADCLDGVCTGNPKKCAAASCSDTVKNGTESDQDCGGSCSKCVDNKLCNTIADCESSVCSGTPKRCQVPSCSDGAKNAAETDIDCGGATCSKCAASKACVVPSDCQSSVCTGNVCQNNTCSDTVKNGTETDVDCGGGCAPGTKCLDGKTCSVNSDCLSNSCSTTCQPAMGNTLKIQARQGDSNYTDNQIVPWIKIVNTGGSPVALSNLKVRYWYTADHSVAQETFCDWASFGCGNMTRAAVPVSPVKDKADYYMEITFAAGAGSVPAGGSVEIQTRANGTGYPSMPEANDYSFTNSTSYADRTNITLYNAGALVWGSEPPAYTNQGLYLQYWATTNSATTTDPRSQWRLYNPDPVAIPLSELTIRYWFTYDGAAGLQDDTGYTDLVGGYSANRVLTSYMSDVIVTTSRVNADRYYEVQFASGAGDIYWGDYVTIQARYYSDVGATFTQTNDYSFDATKTAFANWNKITVYRNGTLVWGTEPTLILRNPENPANTSQGLLYGFYQGAWTALPAFTSMNPTTTGTTTNFDLTKAEVGDNFGLRFTGYIDVPTDGAYTFYTTSDDGSKLFIGTTEVVSNDGLHASQERFGTIGLKAGKHAIRVEMFEAGGGEVLEVRYAGPGIAKTLIPASALFKTPCENPALAYCEDFEDGNANGWTQLNPGTPANWTVVSSAAPVFPSSDVFRQTVSTDADFRFNYASGAAGGPWGDQTVTAWIKPTVYQGGTGDVNHKAGICARFNGGGSQLNSTGYCLYLRADGISGSGRLQMMEKPAGAANAAGLLEVTAGVPAFPVGSWYKVTLKATGTSTVTLTGYINDVQLIQVTDSSAPFMAGYPALATKGAQAEWDDIAVTGEPAGSGTITYERWENVSGVTVANIPVGQAPNVTVPLTLFEAPWDIMDNYGARIRGFLTAPATGNYTFWVAGDDGTVLRLSTDESANNKVDIASVATWTARQEWNKYPTQKSTPIALIAGKRYYIEALVKEGVGGDNLTVGWLRPGQAGSVPSEVIPGAQLSPP
jgi:hypothetical protein